jgi:alanyl aminopeptidase
MGEEAGRPTPGEAAAARFSRSGGRFLPSPDATKAPVFPYPYPYPYMRFSMTFSLRHFAATAALLLTPFAAPLAAVSPKSPAASPSASASTDLAAPPQLRLPAGFAPTRYAVDWTIDPSRETFEGVVDIDLRFDRPAPVLWLNAKEIDIHEAVLVQNGKPVKVRVLPGDENFAGFAFDPPAAVGAARLRIAYQAKINPRDTTGVFRQKVGDDWYVYTQFESIDARRALPCFDEPSYKVPWQLTLRIPRGLMAVSNTPVESETDGGANSRVVRFRATRPLPSYLVAIGVGPFEAVDAGRGGKNSVPIRIIVPRGRASDARYAVETQKPALERLEAYFGIPYPYEKLDDLVIPQTVRFGAMENAGLITWNEGILLARPSEETPSFRRTLASICLHETAHQWFGDYVTLAFWDDTWLNESFATWMAAKLLREWKPEWQRDVIDVMDRSETLERDTLKTARQIRQPILTNGDIDNAFDDISYGKGGAVLAMFESWIGPDKFQAGIRRYLAAHAWSNATSPDFLSSLEKASSPGVAAAFSTFLDQPGFPLVRAQLKCAAGSPPSLDFHQRRLLPKGMDSTAPTALWRVPVCARWGGTGSGQGRACTLLAGADGALPLAGAAACPDWVLANAGEVGYYRVAYADEALKRLLKGGAPELSLAERVGVIGDVQALASLGELPMEQALALVAEFAKDPDRHVTDSLLAILQPIDNHLVPDAVRPRFEAFVRDSFAARAHAVGWTPASGESEEVEILRPILLRLALIGKDPEITREGAAIGKRWLDDRGATSAGIVQTALVAAALEGDRAVFDRMVAEIRTSPDRKDRVRIYTALGLFSDPELERRALALTLDPALDSRESITLFRTAMGYRLTRDMAWEFFKKNFDAFVARLPREYTPVLPRMGGAFCDAAHREDVRAFFEPRIGSMEGAARPLAQALETAGQCVALAPAEGESIARFLAASPR